MHRDNRKILIRISKHPARSFNMQSDEWETVQHLIKQGLVIPGAHQPADKYEVCYTLTPRGKDVLDDERWFTPEFILRNLILPVAVGIASAVLTTILLRVL